LTLDSAVLVKLSLLCLAAARLALPEDRIDDGTGN
jgi:hypothetical protein